MRQRNYLHLHDASLGLGLIMLAIPLCRSLVGETTTNETGDTSIKIVESCNDCRITSKSIDDLVSRPRRMDSYGQIERIDLDKIKKAVCKDIASDLDRERCRNFYFKHLSQIEEWARSKTQASFHDMICIQRMKYCCSPSSYGPKCTRCTKCGENERCSGDGTRTGDGSCICKDGHVGSKCAMCKPGHYAAGQGGILADAASQSRSSSSQKSSSSKITCIKCHKSCLRCRHDGPLGCEVCQDGYNWLAPYGCVDIDECIKSNKTICGPNTFCVNTEGSYFCYECDRACNGCYGDGPDMCLKCGDNYKLEKGNCVALRKTILPPEANYYRYAIYFGLCVCTCILLSNNVYVASSIGLVVALYIGVSEYVMSHHLFEAEGHAGVTDVRL